MTCPHCGFVFEGTAHCPNCGKAPGKPGRDKTYYKEPQKPAQPSAPEVKQGDTQVFTRESRPKQPPVVQVPTVQEKQKTDYAVSKYNKKRKISKTQIFIIVVLAFVIFMAVAIATDGFYLP